MEFVVAGAVAGLGYYLNQNKERNRDTDPEVRVPSYMKPNNRNVYESGERMKNIQIQEQKRSDRLYDEFFDEKNTNVIMQLPGQQIDLNITEWADDDLPIEYNGELNKNQLFQMEKDRLSKDGNCSNINGISLTGEPIKQNDFRHNNMVPFFGGRVTQNVDENANSTMVENFTGNLTTYQNKQELKPLFSPYNKDINNPYGMSNLNGYNKDRYIKSVMRQNEAPLEKILVGPGLNKGFTSQPSGGFQQADTRDYCIPKTVDDLRVKTNPKLTFEGRILAGQHISIRGEIGRQCKYLPEDYYTNLNGERNLITTGEIIADTKRPAITIKDGNRKCSREVMGTAGPNNGNKSNIRPGVRKALRQNFCTDGPRNAAAEEQYRVNSGKEGRDEVKLKPTLRMTQVCKTRTANPAINKGSQTYNGQAAKRTKNEHFVKCSRFNDRMDSTVSKSTVYDPNDTPKTTMKETLIHDKYTGGVEFGARAESSWVMDEDDVARTTMKETSIHNLHNGNIGNNAKAGTVKDPKDKPKNTMKEVDVVNRKNTGQVSNQLPGDGYKTAKYRASETNRQNTSCEYVGNADGPEEGGYKVTKVVAPDTIRQFTSKEYTGGAGSAGESDKPMSYADIYNTNVKSLRDEKLNGWMPGAGETNIMMGPDSVNMKTTRLGAVSNKYLIERNNAHDRIQQNVDAGQLGCITQQTQRVDNTRINERFDPAILDAYRQNPYTQPLPGAYISSN